MSWDRCSRIVTERLRSTSVEQRRPGSSRETRNIYITFVSVYTPTAKAPPAIVQKFMDDLRGVLDKIPTSDMLMLLGDFNTRVGSSGENDLWLGVHGRHGVVGCNEAGETFPEFYALHLFTIMNTWLGKKQHHLARWKHPATKQAHMIDYVIMRADQHFFFTDVQVMSSANCWSDHSVVTAKVRIHLPHLKNVAASTMQIAMHTGGQGIEKRTNR